MQIKEIRVPCRHSFLVRKAWTQDSTKIESHRLRIDVKRRMTARPKLRIIWAVLVALAFVVGLPLQATPAASMPTQAQLAAAADAGGIASDHCPHDSRLICTCLKCGKCGEIALQPGLLLENSKPSLPQSKARNTIRKITSTGRSPAPDPNPPNASILA